MWIPVAADTALQQHSLLGWYVFSGTTAQRCIIVSPCRVDGGAPLRVHTQYKTAADSGKRARYCDASMRLGPAQSFVRWMLVLHIRACGDTHVAEERGLLFFPATVCWFGRFEDLLRRRAGEMR